MVEFLCDLMAVYTTGTDCTTTGMRCSLLDGKFIAFEGGIGWIMCKYCWPPTPGEDATTEPGVNTVDIPVDEVTEVITDGDDVNRGEQEDIEGIEVVVTELGEERVDDTAVGDVLALLIDKSTGSVCV